MRGPFIFILSCGIFLMAGGCHKKPPAEESSQTSMAKAEIPKQDKDNSEDLLRQLKQRNPFSQDHTAGVVSEQSGGQAALLGIIWDPNSPYALIGESVVRVGDSVGNKKVKKITKDTVILDNNGTQEILKLENPF